MAEVKSTIDLVMERTKNMVQSDDEKKKIHTRDLEKKAKGHVLRLMEELIEADELPGVLEEVTPDERGEFKRVLLQALAEALSLEADNGPILAGMRGLMGDDPGPLIREVEDIRGKFIEERLALDRRIRDMLLDRLSAQGISGTAVRIKLDSEPAYAKGLSTMKTEFEMRLERAVKKIIEQFSR